MILFADRLLEMGNSQGPGATLRARLVSSPVIEETTTVNNLEASPIWQTLKFGGID